MSAGSENVEYECALLLGGDGRYLRINADLSQLGPSGSDRFDDASPKNLEALRELGDRTFEQFREPIDRLLEKLIETPNS